MIHCILKTNKQPSDSVLGTHTSLKGHLLFHADWGRETLRHHLLGSTLGWGLSSHALGSLVTQPFAAAFHFVGQN